MRSRPGRLTPRLLRYYHAALSGHDRRDERGAGRQQRRAALGRPRGRDAVHRDDGRHLPHAGGVEAAWKYFILGSVGIALAFFGTILVYLVGPGGAGRGLAGDGLGSMLKEAPRFDPKLLSLAFVFLLVGYGTKVGLAPFHAWLPDAHAEGPTPISAVLSGLLLNVALYALLRFKMILAANAGDASTSGLVLIVLGLISLIFAGFMLYRRRDIKRLFAYSSIEHSWAIITFAFGMGGPLANFAGLLHMTMHSLTKSAIFFARGPYRAGQGHAAHHRHPRPVRRAIRCWPWASRSA